MRTRPRVQLAISVGGSKCAYAITTGAPPAILARSPRVEWTRQPIQTIYAFVEMLARETETLLRQTDILATAFERIGVAWPGPGINGCFQATFIPGCSQGQPIASLLRSALTARFGSAVEGIPIRVMLDAVARAAGEVGPGGELNGASGSGLLVNVATGIAGAIVCEQQAMLVYPKIGENYGQFGRFLFFNKVSQKWDWRPTADGLVPSHSADEVRWTELCAGPALARRIARLCNESAFDSARLSPCVTEALGHYRAEPNDRNAVYEMTLLKLATAEAGRDAEGLFGHFVRRVAWEIGSALCVLLDVFRSSPIKRIVLAGGVGENFGFADGRGSDRFIQDIQLTVGGGVARVSRAHLGVDAEFLGLASDSFFATP